MHFPFPYWHAWHHIGCIQHTLPLLFDDCLTIVEKLDALWCKLNDLIVDYDEFKSDFEQWKGQIEDTLDEIIAALEDLADRVDDLEQALNDLKDRVDDLEDAVDALKDDVDQLKLDMQDVKDGLDGLDGRVETLEGDMQDVKDGLDGLDGRIDDIEDLLRNLNIVVPEELFKENDIDWFITNVSTPWLQQMGLSTSTYTPLRKIIPVASDVGTIPAVSFKVGVLGFPIVYAKIPLMYSFTPSNNIYDNDSFLSNIGNETAMKDFIKAVQDKSTTADAFATVTLYNAPSFQPTDNIKFEGSYAIFQQPGSTSPTVGIEYLTNNTTIAMRTSESRVSVRMVLTQGSTTANMAIAVTHICAYFSAGDAKVYIMLLSEHQ